jgi:hypothetical protein
LREPILSRKYSGGMRVRFGLRRRGIASFGGEFQIKTAETVLELRYLPRS